MFRPTVMRSFVRFALPVATFALASFSTIRARAADFELDHLPAGTIKMDGKTKEWPGTTPADVAIKAGKLKAAFHAGYDDTGIWVGAEIDKDGGVSRTAAFGDNEDRITLTLAFPKPGVAAGSPEYAAYEVAIYAGVPGSSQGAVKMRSPSSGAIAGAQVIEAPRKPGGYTLEAFIPWSAFPEAKKTRAGLRGALRAYDGDGSSIRSIKATSAGSVDDPKSLGWFLIEPEQSLPQSFASRKLSWKDVKYDVTTDLAGDGTYERALFVGKSVYVLGPTYKQGKQWLTMDLDADVVSLEAKDLTGDGHAELLVTARVKPPGTTREGLHVFTLNGEKGAEKPQKIFSHETRVDGGGGKLLEDKLAFSSKKITITYASPKGWDAASWDQPIANDVDPILLPWGTVKERSFVFSGSAFVKDKEVAQKATVVSGASGTVTSTGLTTGPTTAAPPPLPKGDPAALALAQYRKDKGLAPDAKTSFETVVAIGGGKKGRAALFGRDLVVTNDSGSYAFVTMTRFASDKDVLTVSAQDLTPDGREEIAVRGLIRAKLTGGSSGDQDVVREVLLVYAPKVVGTSVSLAPVFAAEVSRSIGNNRVECAVKLVAAKGSTAGKIELGKGAAKGWTSTTYPFQKETPTMGLEPLVLPWSSDSAVYSWNGEKFAR